MTLVCFVSDNQKRLENCLHAYAPQLNESTMVFILSKDQFTCDLELNANRIILMSENDFRDAISNLEKYVSGATNIFKGGYGAFRNAGLFVAASLEKDVIFFDDDTSPAPNCIERHRQLFRDGKQIICGKYVGCAGGTTTILLELISTLESLKDKKISAEAAEEKILDLMGAVPSTTSKPIAGAGFNGGNAGICASAASKYCFFPTKYRVEDGCYSNFSRYFLGETAFYNPQRSNEVYALPVVFHDKKRGNSKKLYENLVSETRGSVIAQFIDSSLVSSDKKASLTIASATEQAYKNYLLGFFKEKILSQKLDDIIMSFRAEIRVCFSELLSLSPSMFNVSDEEISSAVDLFFFSQRNWTKLISLGQKTKFASQLNEFGI